MFSFTAELSAHATLLHGLIHQRARAFAARMGQLSHGISEMADFLMLQAPDQFAGDVIRFLQRLPDQLGQIMQWQRPIDPPFIPHLLDKRFFLVELILNLSHQFLQNIFERHNPQRPAVFVHHRRKM